MPSVTIGKVWLNQSLRGIARHFPGLGILAKIMQARPMVVCWLSKAKLTGKLPEVAIDTLQQQPAATLSDKKPTGMFITASCVPQQDLLRCEMKRHEAGLAEFCVSDGEDALLQIDIITPHLEGFADAQPGYGEEPQETYMVQRRSPAAGGNSSAAANSFWISSSL
jgi:hypothetical protein